MCKQNELLGSVLMACGAGFLLSMLFKSQFLLALLGIGLLAIGLVFSRKT
ncbi:MAG: hypothetical protein LBM28_03205 [Oscillospiraceae bacterium]|jgi:hypothetical protein|nr:hypothetical protein [Oscillospiraceae bacterium]